MDDKVIKELKRGECGGQSCPPKWEERMSSLAWTTGQPSMREAFLMCRGMARNGRVIRKPILGE